MLFFEKQKCSSYKFKTNVVTLNLSYIQTKIFMFTGSCKSLIAVDFMVLLPNIFHELIKIINLLDEDLHLNLHPIDSLFLY